MVYSALSPWLICMGSSARMLETSCLFHRWYCTYLGFIVLLIRTYSFLWREAFEEKTGWNRSYLYLTISWWPALDSTAGYSGFQVTGVIEWGQKSKPIKLPRVFNKPHKKNPWTKSWPKKTSHAEFPSLKNLHKVLNDITRKIRNLRPA